MFQFLWDIFAENYVNDIKKTQFILLENDFGDNSSKVLVLNHFIQMLGTLTSYQIQLTSWIFVGIQKDFTTHWKLSFIIHFSL